jgi:hypothetical protein
MAYDGKITENEISQTLGNKLDNIHTHSNKTVLDSTTASYTTEEKTKLSGIATGANNYTLPVASTAIGGVKSGTDITVDASGNVTVVDDSHNHVINNIDNLQTTLDNKLNSNIYTANDVLIKLLTVDGDGSGIDADKLDGKHSSYFLNIVAAPSSATSTGTVGQVAYDVSFFYICVATNTWKRVSITGW